MGRFAKIIELPDNEQVLVTKGWNEEDGDTLTIQTDVDGMHVTATMNFKTPESRDDRFDTYGEEQASKWHKEMRNLLLEDNE